MPFGAHETMETHEILMEKINCITHFNLYARACRNPQLRDMIARHQQEEITTYNQIVAYTHDYIPFTPIAPNTDIRGVNPQNIQYGANNPSPLAPQADANLNDQEIANAMLWHHKNGARNSSWACLETADPNLRRMLMNSAATCINQAYEVFLFMNEQGVYPVPTLNDNMAKSFIHRYQPADEALQAQYGLQAGPNAGNVGPSMGYGGQQGSDGGAYMSPNMVGDGARGNASYGGMNVGSRNSPLYGNPGAYGGGQAAQSQQNVGVGAAPTGASPQNRQGDVPASVNPNDTGSIPQ